MTPTIRCEKAPCAEPATTLNSRVDAIRDWLYTCDGHRPGGIFKPSTLPAPWAEVRHLTQPRLSLEMLLATWMPKHRQVSRDAAKAIVQAAV